MIVPIVPYITLVYVHLMYILCTCRVNLVYTWYQMEAASHTDARSEHLDTITW